MKIRLTIPRLHMQSIEVDAFLPCKGAYIATMRPLGGNGHPVDDAWGLVHVPTGKRLGALKFKTRKAALDLLGRCDPIADCWRDAKGKGDDPATSEAYAKIRSATTEGRK